MKENIQKEIHWLLQEKYNGNKTAEAEKDIARLEKGEHVDYVIGWVHFLGCKIDLSKRPLIPRPETEYWVKKAIEEIKGISKGKSAIRTLDLFAGSGCAGVAVLKHVPSVYVDFAEKEETLLKQIELNAALNEISTSRYSILSSDIFSGVRAKYKYILANPPYVPEKNREQVQRSVIEQEPHEAVFAGENGLLYIRSFFKEVENYILPGGVVYMEFDSEQKEEIEKLAKQAGGTEISIEKDQYEKWRYARIVF
jgi:release factor glutamine methyltransferase